MILNLVRNLIPDDDDLMSQFTGCNTQYTKLRIDRVDGFSVEDDELVLIVNGNEFFFEYDELIHIQLDNYFNVINTTIQ